MAGARDAGGLRSPTPGARGVIGALAGLGLLLLPAAAAGQGSPCSAPTVCNESSSMPADDWFRHGLEALGFVGDGAGDVAVCALQKASELHPEEDGHSVGRFVKPFSGLRSLPRDCDLSSSPLDRKKYLPRLYLAKAYFALAMRAQGAEKEQLCAKALRSLDDSRQKAPLAKVWQQMQKREVGGDLEGSGCCVILPNTESCSTTR